MRRTLLVLVAAALGAAPADAQRRRAEPGWIGISFEAQRDRRGRYERVEITDVREGSPAQAVGLRVGDLLVSVNDLDRPSELAQLPSRLRLRAGDPVRIEVRRRGRRAIFELVAGERPRDFESVERVTLSIEPDSLVESMVRSMDSIRMRVVRGQSVAVVAPPQPSSAITVNAGAARGVVPPFEFFVFRGEAHDSLRLEMEALNELLEDLERRLERRSREIERSSGRVTRVALTRDPQFRTIQEERDEAAIRSVELRRAMADAARETAGFRYSTRVEAPADEPAVWTDEFRPLTPYLLGQNRVAGAQVIDLRPELASYFEGVEGGVLVVDVAPRTPAAIAGIEPGDVITRMDQVAVRSVDDLRFGVSQAAETLPVTLIRRGTSLQVLLRR